MKRAKVSAAFVALSFVSALLVACDSGSVPSATSNYNMHAVSGRGVITAASPTSAPTYPPVAVPCSSLPGSHDPSWLCIGDACPGGLDPLQQALCEDNDGSLCYDTSMGRFYPCTPSTGVDEQAIKYVSCLEDESLSVLNDDTAEITDSTMLSLVNFIMNDVIPQAGSDQMGNGSTELNDLANDTGTSLSGAKYSALYGWEQYFGVAGKYPLVDTAVGAQVMGGAVTQATTFCKNVH